MKPTITRSLFAAFLIVTTYYHAPINTAAENYHAPLQSAAENNDLRERLLPNTPEEYSLQHILNSQLPLVPFTHEIEMAQLTNDRLPESPIQTPSQQVLYTQLRDAVYEGNLEKVQLALEAGAHPNALLKNCLHTNKIIKCLIGCSSATEYKLCLATCSGSLFTIIVYTAIYLSFLTEKYTYNMNLYTSLFIAGLVSMLKAASYGNPIPLLIVAQEEKTQTEANQIIQLLLQHNATPDDTDSEGNTALMRAITKKNAATVEMLCLAGADAHRRNIWGENPLSEASPRIKNIIYALEKAKETVYILQNLLSKDGFFAQLIPVPGVVRIIADYSLPLKNDKEALNERSSLVEKYVTQLVNTNEELRQVYTISAISPHINELPFDLESSAAAINYAALAIDES